MTGCSIWRNGIWWRRPDRRSQTGLTKDELQALGKRLREARDRSRSIAHRQKREIRGKTGPRGAVPARDNTGSEAKTEVLVEGAEAGHGGTAQVQQAPRLPGRAAQGGAGGQAGGGAASSRRRPHCVQGHAGQRQQAAVRPHRSARGRARVNSQQDRPGQAGPVRLPRAERVAAGSLCTRYGRMPCAVSTSGCTGTWMLPRAGRSRSTTNMITTATVTDMIRVATRRRDPVTPAW